MVAGTEGYAEHARALFLRDQDLSFEEKHQAVLHLLPTEPCTVIDIGAGTGADAAWFAKHGHEGVAVEPTDELRLPGIELHRARSIEWTNDSLPHLLVMRRRGRRFGPVLLIAVWMHLD